MGKDDLISSALGRFLRISGLMGRVGASMLGSKALDLVSSDGAEGTRRTDNLILNATRIVETLGELKGAAMKVGQMLSLHEGLLPPEVSAILRALQREAPPVPFEVMQDEIRGELDDFDRIFEFLDPEAFAAASIGQVHRGKLRDGREVAVKIQYPLIEEIIRADLKNLRRILKTLFSMFTDIDFAPIWQEVRDRLFEELDYVHEAKSLKRMAKFHTDVAEIVIPSVVDEASTKRVLTMEYLEGIPPEEACSSQYDQELKNRWGIALYDFLFRGLLGRRLLHADPNMSNFAFLEDGRVIVYDFGCVKRIPKTLATGYAHLILAALDERWEDVPEVLARMGVHREDGTPLTTDLTDPYVELVAEIIREEPPYTFGDNAELYQQFIDFGLANWSRARDIKFPRHVVFIDRSLGGHFGNLSRLNATGPWRDLVEGYAEPYRES